MKDFNGKLAVVTGGASGVGFAIGEALAKEGAKVILTDVEQESLEASTATLVEQSLEVSCKVADVSDSSSMHELAEWCQSEHGSVHLLFNNAGVAPAELLPIWDRQNEATSSGSVVSISMPIELIISNMSSTEDIGCSGASGSLASSSGRLR